MYLLGVARGRKACFWLLQSPAAILFNHTDPASGTDTQTDFSVLTQHELVAR